MRKIAFIIAIFGLGLLVAFLLKEPLKVNSLDELIVGEIVELEGLVEEERKFGKGKLLIVGENRIYCECNGKYVGLNVLAEGIVERFPDDLRVRAFSIQILD